MNELSTGMMLVVPTSDELMDIIEDTGMSENCLYLSIWSSSLAPDSLTSVILILSSGQEPDSAVEASGVEMAALGGVVVVTAETRHGALGFLAAEDSVVTGPPDVCHEKCNNEFY